MNSFLVLLKKDITSIIRTKKFLIMLLVLISFAILSPISAKMIGKIMELLGDEFQNLEVILGGSTYVDSYVQLNGNLAEMFIFILIIMFAGSIIKENTKGTYFILKTNGISKNKFILSHILSQIIMVTISYVASIIIFLLTTLILFGKCLPNNYLYSLTSLYMFIIFFVILINFISAFSKSSTQSMILNFSSYFGFLMINMFGKIKYFFPFSLTDSVVSVLDRHITKECNISIIVTFIWCVSMLLILFIFSKDKINNRK